MLPETASRLVPGSSWGTFTIACTIPIALFVGLYMYKLRKGAWSRPRSSAPWRCWPRPSPATGFPARRSSRISRSRASGRSSPSAAYGFIASVLPVWLLLCPRDYLSSFLKIGTVALLVGGGDRGQSRARRPRRSTRISPRAAGRTSTGRSFRSVFICIMCGAISGFHCAGLVGHDAQDDRPRRATSARSATARC